MPLDRSGAIGGTVSIFLERKPTAAAPPQGAVFALEGGPGFAGTANTSGYAQGLAPALQTRDLIVMDYRGTGRSGALSCASRVSASCSAEIGPRRILYSTKQIIDDIESVRQALGVDKIMLYGVSYGSKIAQAYARRYGNHVELLVLDSVVPTDGWDPWRRATYHSIPRVLREICASGRCAGVTADPVADLTAFIQRLQKGPVRVQYINPDGSRGSIALTLYGLWRIYNGTPGMFYPVTRARFVAALASARRGDLVLVGRLYRELQAAGEGAAEVAASRDHGDPDFNPIAWLATLCEDDPFPWRGATSREEKLARLRSALAAMPASEFAPFPPETALENTAFSACLDWSISNTSPAIPPVVPYRGRTLIIHGAWDLRTPLEYAEAAASELGATLLTVPAEGHSLLGYSPCANQAFADFVANRPVQQCAPATPPTNQPIAPTSLKGQKLWPGIPGSRGKLVRAVVRTLGDMTYTAYGPGPFVGLRGGTAKVVVAPDRSTYTMTLNRVVYCPGVVVSGTYEILNYDARVTVTGGGLRGTLRITSKTITGTLGGKKIRAIGVG